MKKALVGLFSLLMLGMPGVAGATPFSNVVDFTGSGTFAGQDYLLISDSNSSAFVGGYSHNVAFNPSAVSVQSASLTINYAYANEIAGASGPKEVWFINDNGGTLIGTLAGADGPNTWYSQTFDLSSYILGVSGSNWTIAFKFNETTVGTDTFYLDKSTLSGDYTANTTSPVPEPGTIVLLGAGLMGLGLYSRRRMKK